MRKKISITDPASMIAKMSEGNPGAFSVLVEMLNREFGLFDILNLDDMNIWGPMIWIGFKHHCGEDLEKFVECCKKRDPEMVATINREAEMAGRPERAVVGGASFGRRSANA